jgi:hypothetical protein
MQYATGPDRVSRRGEGLTTFALRIKPHYQVTTKQEYFLPMIMDEGFVYIGARRNTDEASAVTVLGALIQIAGKNFANAAFRIARNILPATLHIDLLELGMFARHYTFSFIELLGSSGCAVDGLPDRR